MGFFEPTPLPPRNSKNRGGGDELRLPYTHVLTSMMKLGYPFEYVTAMSWSRVIMTLDAESEAMEKASPKSSDEVRDATPEDIKAWI